MIERLFQNNNEKITKKIWLYFSVIVIINVLFKIIYLGYSSFWYDEIISLESAWLDFGHIKHVSEWDNNPPFYYYCLSVWIKLFDDSEFCVRLLSVVFSSLSAGVLFLFANKFFNKTTAIIVSLMYLSSNVLFFYSHEARAYSLVVFLALLSSFLYLNFKQNPSLKISLFLGLINFLLIYTHYIAGIVVFFQVLLILIYFKKKQATLFSYSISVIIFLTLIRFTKKQFLIIFNFNDSEKTFWLQKSSIKYLNEVASNFLFHKTMIAPFILIIVLGIFLIYNKEIKKTYFVVTYVALVGIGSVFILFFLGKITPIFLDRYLIFTLPFIFLLIAIGLSFFKNQSIIIALSFVFFIFSAFKIDYKTSKPMDYKNAVGFIKHIKTNEDLIIVKFNAVPSLFCYYYEKDYLKLQKKRLTNALNVLICKTWQDVEVDVNNYKRVIVVDAFEDSNPINTEINTNLSQQKKHHSIISYYKGVKITFYQ